MEFFPLPTLTFSTSPPSIVGFLRAALPWFTKVTEEEDGKLAKRILGKNSEGRKRRKTAFQRLSVKQEGTA